MRPVLKSEEIPQLDAWGMLLFLFLLEFFAYLIFSLSAESLFPSLSIDLLALIVKVLAYLAIFVFCLIRFGRINLIELIPDRRDALILLVALMIEFWVFGLLVGSEGIRNDRHDAIRNLPALQYWLGVSIVVGWGPFFEEALFRRYFLEIQCQHHSTVVAVLITATVGMIFHFNFELAVLRLVWHFCQEVFSCVVYVNSRLGVAVVVHAFVNALVLFLSR